MWRCSLPQLEPRGSDFGLHGDGVGHYGVKVVAVHLAEYAVDGLHERGVALQDGDADVDVLISLIKETS